MAVATSCATAEVALASQPDQQHIMIVVATSGPANAGTGVAMTRLVFPSEQACHKAARILEGSIPGGAIVARCIPTR